jgi:hypothetical protein
MVAVIEGKAMTMAGMEPDIEPEIDPVMVMETVPVTVLE